MFDESQYFIMPTTYSRPAQIPLRAVRFRYLTKEYMPGSGESSWVMFHHPGHFMVYDMETRRCVFDGSYEFLRDPEDQPDDELVAVIYEIRINQNEKWHPITEDTGGFGDFVKLITEEL